MTAALASTALAIISATTLVVVLPGQAYNNGTPGCVIGSPTATIAGAPVIATVYALVDTSGCGTTTATSTVHITSSDANATLPANAALAGGTGTFSVTFKTAGSWTVTATDVAAVLNAGTSSSITVNPGAEVKLQIILPGETAAPGTLSGKTGTPNAQSAGIALPMTVNAVDANWNVVTGTTGSVSIGSNDPAFVHTSTTLYSGGVAFFAGAFNTAGNWFVTATDTHAMSGTSAAVSVSVPAAKFVVSAPTSAAAGTSFSLTVTAQDLSSNITTGYRGTVHFTSTDPAATLPANYTFTAGDNGVHVFSVILNTAGTWSVTATDVGNAAVTGSQTGIVVTTPGTYHALTPARLLDTRTGNGISGPLSANSPATFMLWGRGGVPYNATAVTGNLTVTDSTSGWAVFLGPSATASPTSSTINFTAGQVVANGVTVALSSSGTLSATYISTAGQTTNLVFDVTGYFTSDTTGAYYFPIAPARLLDTRYGVGLSAKLTANSPATFQVTGTGYVPSNATAVTGNLTVTGSTSGWAIFLGPNATATPSSSTINFKTGGVVANGVTVALSSLGQLSATYISTTGQTTDLVFDVTGYFVQGGSTGARFMPLTPVRLLDTRYGNGISGALPANSPGTFTVWGRGGVPTTTALGVTGNLTITDQTSGWAVFIGPNPVYSPTTSTINFTTGQILANGVTVGLSSTGTLSATYISSAGQTTNLVFDVTGYFVH
jgi:hypothetical protein